MSSTAPSSSSAAAVPSASVAVGGTSLPSAAAVDALLASTNALLASSSALLRSSTSASLSSAAAYSFLPSAASASSYDVAVLPSFASTTALLAASDALIASTRALLASSVCTLRPSTSAGAVVAAGPSSRAEIAAIGGPRTALAPGTGAGAQIADPVQSSRMPKIPTTGHPGKVTILSDCARIYFGGLGQEDEEERELKHEDPLFEKHKDVKEADEDRLSKDEVEEVKEVKEVEEHAVKEVEEDRDSKEVKKPDAKDEVKVVKETEENQQGEDEAEENQQVEDEEVIHIVHGEPDQDQPVPPPQTVAARVFTRSFYRKGMLEIERGHYGRALAYADHIILRHPDQAIALVAAAELYSWVATIHPTDDQDNLFLQAELLATRARPLAPNSSFVLLVLARTVCDRAYCSRSSQTFHQGADLSRLLIQNPTDPELEQLLHVYDENLGTTTLERIDTVRRQLRDVHEKCVARTTSPIWVSRRTIYISSLKPRIRDWKQRERKELEMKKLYDPY